MKKRLEHKSKLLEGFGAVEPHQRPEDRAKIREEVETLIAEDVATGGERTAPKEEDHE